VHGWYHMNFYIRVSEKVEWWVDSSCDCFPPMRVESAVVIEVWGMNERDLLEPPMRVDFLPLSGVRSLILEMVRSRCIFFSYSLRFVSWSMGLVGDLLFVLIM